MSDRVTFVGSFKGTGASLNIITLGFRPRVLKLMNVDGLCELKWQQGMADASGVKTVTDGTISHITTLGITPLSNGFTLGADTDVNVSGEEVHFEAHD